MRRSKLELHVDVLIVLDRHGPLKPTQIMHKVNVDYSFLKKSLNCLIQHSLVDKQTLAKKRQKTRSVYTINERGRTLLKYFREINSALQIIQETQAFPALQY